MQELVLPRGQTVKLEREDHHRSTGHPAKLGQTGLGGLPVMDRHAGHPRVDRAVIEGKRLRASGDRRRRTGGALGPHGCARLDSKHPATTWLVGPRAGANIEHRARIAERGVNARGDPRVRAPVSRIGAPVPLIVNPSSHPRSIDNLAVMAYTTVEARQRLLDAVAEATDEIGFALASLGDAYERLDEHTADELEQELFLPVQLAYGRAQRAHAEFADRHGLPRRVFESASGAAPSYGVRDLLDSAIVAVGRADSVLAALQDSMLPVEVGDVDLRAGLQDVRRLLSDLRGRTRELVRTLGR